MFDNTLADKVVYFHVSPVPGEHFEMLIHDLSIASHRRPCLTAKNIVMLCRGSRLLDQRLEQSERDTVLFQQILGYSVHET